MCAQAQHIHMHMQILNEIIYTEVLYYLILSYNFNEILSCLDNNMTRSS